MHVFNFISTAAHEILTCLENHWTFVLQMITGLCGAYVIMGCVHAVAHTFRRSPGGSHCKGCTCLQAWPPHLGKHMVSGRVCPRMSRICPLHEVVPTGEFSHKPHGIHTFGPVKPYLGCGTVVPGLSPVASRTSGGALRNFMICPFRG